METWFYRDVRRDPLLDPVDLTLTRRSLQSGFEVMRRRYPAFRALLDGFVNVASPSYISRKCAIDSELCSRTKTSGWGHIYAVNEIYWRERHLIKCSGVPNWCSSTMETLGFISLNILNHSIWQGITPKVAGSAQLKPRSK